MKIAFLVMPAHGHVNPTLAVAGELVARGHEVIYYLTDEFAPAVRRLGARFQPVGEGFDIIKAVEKQGGAFAHRGSDRMAKTLPMLFTLMAWQLQRAPALIDELRAEKPDAIVYDPMCVWGRLAPQALGVPGIAFATSYVGARGSRFEREMRARMPSPRSKAMLAAIARFEASALWLAARHGLPLIGIGDVFGAAERLTIVPMPRRFHPEAEQLDARYVFAGPFIGPRGGAEGFPLTELEGRRVLFISLGTTPMNNLPAFYDACMEAFGGSRFLVVMSSGSSTLDPARIPANFIVRPRVPQLEVLARTSVFITHGGMNSTMEGLWNGVPLVVVPQMGEQAFTASRVAELGIGRSLEGVPLTAAALGEAVDAVDSDPAYRARAIAYQADVQSAGGQGRAAAAIEQIVLALRGAKRWEAPTAAPAPSAPAA
jgi:MGT family glycosyltransferase